MLPPRAGGLPLVFLSVPVPSQGRDAAVRQGQGAPGLPGLGVAAPPHGAPDREVRRDRGIGVRASGQVHVLPGERTQLLGAGTGEEGDDDVGVHGVAFDGPQDRCGLGERYGLGRPARLTGGHGAQRHDVPVDSAADQGSLHRAVQTGVHALQGARAERARLRRQPRVDVVDAEFAQLPVAQDGDDMGVGERGVQPHRLRVLAREAVRQPVGDRVLDGVAGVGRGVGLQFVEEFPEFVSGLGLALCASASHDPFAGAVMPEAHAGDPALAPGVPVEAALSTTAAFAHRAPPASCAGSATHTRGADAGMSRGRPGRSAGSPVRIGAWMTRYR